MEHFSQPKPGQGYRAAGHFCLKITDIMRLLSLTALIVGLPVRALAQTPSFIPAGGVPGCDFVTGNLSKNCVPLFIAHALQTIFAFVGGICLILIIIAGYQILLAVSTGGDRSGGIQTLRWAITGFIVSALTFFIIDFIISTIAGL